MGDARMRRLRLADGLEEVTKGVGSAWRQYRLVGATREGLAPAKEGIGKNPERYKLVAPGTIFYNPMRILLGSIALLDAGQEPGITSPDYVVFRARPGLIHPRWFYYWLRSEQGAAFVRTLARGAVRERMLFRRLAAVEAEVPAFEFQQGFASVVEPLERACAAAEAQLAVADALAVAYIRSVFEESRTRAWPTRRLADECTLLPSRSIASDGDTVVLAITTACLTETGFRPEGVKPARMSAASAAQCIVRRGEVLVARSNTTELVGRACLFDGNPPGAVASDLTIRVETGTKIYAPFLAALLSFLYVTGYWRERSGGASGSMKKITRSQLASQAILVPELEVQKRVCAELSERMSSVERIKRTVDTQLRTMAAPREALLRRAFSGEA